MRGFKMAKIYCPIHKVRVKRHYYRTIILVSAVGIWVVHEYHPHYEMHAAFLTNLLFAIDPT